MEPLDLTSKLFQPEVAQRLGDRAPAGPIVVELDPTSYCNLECPDCVTIDVLNDGRLPSSRLLDLAEEFASCGVKAVILIGGGEPLLHSSTPALVDRLFRAGIQVGLVTNGTRLADHAVQLARQCRWIRVSVDAATSSTYRRVRPHRGETDMFSKVITGIEAAVRAPDRLSTVGFSFVVFGNRPLMNQFGNSTEVLAAATLAKALGCSYVEFKGEMAGDHQLRPVPAREREALREQVEQASALADATFGVHLSTSLRAVLAGEPEPGQAKNYSTCAVARFRTTVSPSGTFVCSYHRGNQRFSYGNVGSTEFGTLWRSRTETVNPSRDCNFHCARHDTNLLIDSGTFDGPGTSLDESPVPTDFFI